jgi:Penicillin-insensitive murein endopeptidase
MQLEQIKALVGNSNSQGLLSLPQNLLNPLRNREDEDYFGYYIPRFQAATLFAEPCSPPTPVEQLDQYSAQAQQYNSQIRQVLDNATPSSLLMRDFANALDGYVRFIRALPSEFCVDSSNQGSFDNLKLQIQAADTQSQRGISFYEANFADFVNEAARYLGNLINESSAISQVSRDYQPVIRAAQAWENFEQSRSKDIFIFNSRMESDENRLNSTFSNAQNAFNQSLEQIQSNVESESNRFAQARRDCETAKQHWDTEDGNEGYDRFLTTAKTMNDSLIPSFNDFIQKVPATDRVRIAVDKAQTEINTIETIFKNFPDFDELPTSADSGVVFNEYGKRTRKFGNATIIQIVLAVATLYNTQFSWKLSIGDMQYQHGGKAKPHKSHRSGNDADVDPVEIGNYPDNDKAKAIEVGKIILSSGGNLVFYADSEVVDAVNDWATTNGISGRLQVEASHTNHFHIRV